MEQCGSTDGFEFKLLKQYVMSWFTWLEIKRSTGGLVLQLLELKYLLSVSVVGLQGHDTHCSLARGQSWSLCCMMRYDPSENLAGICFSGGLMLIDAD